MSGPAFLLDLSFADLAGWWLQLECCGRTVSIPFAFLAVQRRDGTLGGLLRRLRCRDCGRAPGRVTLLDEPADRVPERTGAPGGWRIEIVLPDGWR